MNPVMIAGKRVSLRLVNVGDLADWFKVNGDDETRFTAPADSAWVPRF